MKRARIAILLLLLLLPRTLMALELSEEERDWIERHPTLSLGINPDYAPIEFIDDLDRYSGLVADYVGLISDRLGVELRPRKGANWRETYALALRGTIDVIASGVQTKVRDQDFLFTPAYAEIASVVVVRKSEKGVLSADDLAGRTLALLTGHADSAQLLEQMPGAKVLFLASTLEALESVSSGQADAAVAPLPVVAWLISKHGLSNLKVAGSNPVPPAKLQFMVHKSQPVLRNLLNKALASIDADEHMRIQQRWFNVEYEPGLDPRAVVRKAVLAAALVALVIALLVWWGIRMQREIRTRKQAESEARQITHGLQEHQQELEKANQRLRDMTDSMTGAVFRIRAAPGEAPEVEFASGQLLHELGLESGSITGTMDAGFFKTFDPESRPQIERAVLSSLQTLEHWEGVYKVDTPDGRDMWVRTDLVPRREADGVVVATGYSVDVTQSRAAERALEDMREEMQRALSATSMQLRGVLENSPGAIWACNRDGVYLLANDAFRRVFELGAKDITGHKVEEFFSEALLESFQASDQKVLETRRSTSSVEVMKQAGGARHVLMVKFPLISDHQIIAIGGIGLDITEQMRLQDELQRLNANLELRVDSRTRELKATLDELATAREVAESAASAKGEFLARMSHEIRTPMNAIIGLSHLGLKSEDPSRQHDYLGKINTAGQSLLGLINDILDFSKIEAGKLAIEEAEFDLNPVLDNLATIVGQRAHEKFLEFLIERPHQSPRLVGDPLRLGQVLINLANNAVKFTDKGEVHVQIELEPRSGDRVLLRARVRDTGIGLNAEQISRLFQSFEQADASTTRRHGGTGLGLAICKQLVELMGGEIGVESVLGQGSTFWFTVPLKILQERRSTGKVVPPSLQGLRVLVVDDSRTVRQVSSRYLEAFGFQTDMAGTGEEALSVLRDAARSPEKNFDLVLMDWKMPDMDGVRCSTEVRSMEFPHGDPRIIMVSSYSREELGRLLNGQKIDAYLVKPVNPSMLFEGILVAFGLKAATEPGRPGQAEADAARGLAGLKVLVVEDHPMNQQIAREVLEGAGIIVDMAGNGAEGLRRVQVASYDLVLMDVQMPIMDGLEATRKIREIDRFASLPIIAMTANAMDQDRKSTHEAGMNAHVAKPINVFELFSTIRELSGRTTDDGVTETQRAETPKWPARSSEKIDLPRIRNLDSRTGLRRAQNDFSRYRRLLEMFVSSEQDAVERIENSLRAGEAEAAVRHAHSLKGVAAMVGADELAKCAADMEQRIRQERSDAESLDVFRKTIDEVCVPLAAWLQSSAEGHKPVAGAEPKSVSSDEDKLPELLQVLEQQLAADDTAAADTIEQVSLAMSDHPGRGQVPGLRRAIQAYDFAGAMDALLAIRSAAENTQEKP